MKLTHSFLGFDSDSHKYTFQTQFHRIFWCVAILDMNNSFMQQRMRTEENTCVLCVDYCHFWLIKIIHRSLINKGKVGEWRFYV